MLVTLRTALLSLPLCFLSAAFCPAHAATENLLMLKGGALSVKQVQADGSLLATWPASTFSRAKLPGGDLQISIAQSEWNKDRGIYQSGIPGIGFSFCTADGATCLQNGKTISGDRLRSEMGNFAIRLFKIGNVTAGDFTLPALMTISSQGTPALVLGLNALKLNVSQCSVTRENLRVRFPDATLSKKNALSAVGFHLPVICKNAADYDNISIYFSFSGQRVDARHIATSLPGIALSVKNEAGRYVDFSAAANDPNARFHDTGYVAQLVRNPREQAQAGEFDVSITAEVEMR
ncbi:Fimbrial protein [Lelliottia nimipressuralis]|uniref:hypothetical protein n=1 Tax=Lelliottia nimipressuralis TaxID=69220 RepID=UPI003B23C3C5